MKKIITLFCAFILFTNTPGYSQTLTKKTQSAPAGNAQIKWKTAPFNHQVFIENNGQFDGAIPGNEKILYGVQLGGVWAYFTSHGVTYRYVEMPKKHETVKDDDKDNQAKAIVHYLNSSWEGANALAAITPEGIHNDYYTYGAGRKNTIKAYAFNQLVYKNLYPGVDAVYEFIVGKNGIKYSLIVHPGADISKILLKYPDAVKLKLLQNGDITFTSSLGKFTEHSPVGGYSGDMGSINVLYQVAGNVESFRINGNYDKNKTIVIDPWITNPNFANYDRAYDICYDYFGNVYAYGGQMPFQLSKFNKVGTKQWTFTVSAFHFNSYYYGAFATDRKTGTSYVTSGFWLDSAQVLKVNTYGNLQATYVGNPSINEMWRAVYNPCYDNIIIGAGGTTDTNQACMLDTNLVSIIGVDWLHTQLSDHDVAMVCVDPSGLYCYMATVQTAGNVFAQLPLPKLNPATYIKPDHFDLAESNVAKYVANQSYASGAMNGAAASPTWLYLYDGASLKQYAKNTGTLNDSIAVSNSNVETYWGGIDVDGCDDIYLGCRDSIKYYDGSLTQKGSIVMPNTVYALVLGQNNLLYAAGDSFVCAVTVPNPPNLISSAKGAPSSCSACDGKATVTINCGVTPFTFKWSNGNTSQTDSGMCAGIYTVYVTDGSCPPRHDSAIVIINGKNGYNAPVKDTNPGCVLFRGNITAYPTGGAAPYTYSWSNGETTQEDTGLVAGTYTCVITDNTGCKAFVLVTLINPTGPVVSVIPPFDSVCLGSSLHLNASGAKTYTWAPPLGLSCNNCANPIATPTVTTTYTITGTDSNGCTDVVTNLIKVYPAPTPTLTGKDSVCSGYTDTLIAKGGSTYKWSNGATTSSIKYKAITTTTVTVTAYNGFCSKDTSIVIHVVSPAAKIKASSDSVCQGDSILLSASGGLKYKWNTGSTTTNIWVKPQKNTTYTLYAYGPTCKDSALQSIKITPKITAIVAAIHDTVCPRQSTIITATGLGGKVNGYRWNNGATTATITVNDTVTTTYTATVYGLCDSVQTVMQVVVVPLPKPIISGSNWRCFGKHDTLSVSSATNPTKYLWDNGKTTTTITTGAINADSLVSVTAYNSLGCAVTIVDSVYLRIPPSAKANPVAIFCAGQPITLTASAQGTFQPFNYTWNTGQTGTSITIDPGPDSTTTYTVYASNGCIGSATTTAIPNVPVLNACCSQILTNLADTTILVANGNSKTYLWQESPDKGSITCINPPLCDSVRVIAPVSTSYTVIGTDSNGCQGEQVLLVDIDVPCFDVRIPNVITPNNPGPLGLNGLFYIRTLNMSAWSMTIYDRWGKEMFHSTDPGQYWTGTTEGGGKASDGVYYYIIDATCQQNSYKKDGFVQLIR